MIKKVIFYGLCACKYGLTDFTGWRSGRIWDSKPYVGGLNPTSGTVRNKMTEKVIFMGCALQQGGRILDSKS
jgi:hypothetical protein